jgi:hypothetical protein
MKPEARIFTYNGQFWFDIVDTSDTITEGNDVLPELLFTSKKGYTREHSCERAADKAVAEFSKASDAGRRKICGYDPRSECDTRQKRAQNYRAGNRNTPVRQPDSD